MILYGVRRFINYLILTMLATVLGYVLASLVLDPATRFYGRNPRPSDAAIQSSLQRLGVDPDVPVLQRTWDWLSGIFLHGSFGLENNLEPVGHDMLVRAGISLQLLLIGSLLGAALGVSIGVWGAVRQYQLSDQIATYASYLILATPVFVLGVLLMMLATNFNTAAGQQVIEFTGQYTPGVEGTWNVLLDRASHLLLPTIALAALGAAEYSRYQRNAMLDVLSADYIRTARSKGRTRNSAMVRHGVRVALIPMSTYFAYSFGTLVAGSTFLELIFSWHGMGELFLTSITENDVNAAAGTVFYLSILVLISSTLAELLYAALDPESEDLMAVTDPLGPIDVDLAADLTGPGKAPPSSSRARLIWLRLRATPRFWVGAITIVAMIVWAIAGLWITPWSPTDQDLLNASTGPTTTHWFGTDDIGQDIYAETVSGLRKSLVIGLIAGPAGTAIAAFVGAFAGYLGGRADAAISWMINLLLVLPAFFVLVLLSPVFKSLSFLVLAAFIALFSWMVMAQVIRAQTKSLRDREFVKAARFMGVGTPAIIRRHILPNVASLLIIDATLGVVAAIDSETALSYFGFGIERPEVSLGLLLAEGTPSATTRPWIFLFPAIVLVVLLFAVSLVGDALRDAVDPTSGNAND